jgi:hypothetical protein
MDPTLKRELVKDAFGLGAVAIYFCTIFLAAFRWSETARPLRAAASIPLMIFIAAYVYKRYFAGTKGEGNA